MPNSDSARLPSPLRPPDVAALADALLLDDTEWLSGLIELLEDRKQIVLYGPPGTGKTYVARALARFIAEADDRTEVVQFHPSYAYEQFVEGYAPQVDGGAMVYALRHGPLVDLADRAARNPERRYVLLIDEINRGNLPKIFGELLYLLEYRTERVRLMYRPEGEPFEVPANLYFIGTMNTADRSIGVIDAALRRRFHFFGLFPNRRPVASTLTKWVAAHAPLAAWLPPVVRRLNDQLRAIDTQLQVGHSYFMRTPLDDAKVELIWSADILPYLEDQLFGREDVHQTFALDRLRGDAASRLTADAEAQDAVSPQAPTEPEPPSADPPT